MNSEDHETLPAAELPAPELKAQLPEYGNNLVPRTEIAGVKAAELPQTGASSISTTHPEPLLPATASPDPSATIKPGHAAAPAIADDNDLIEKEWVLKAKAIVAKNREDPYAQNKEMNLYKATYVKKRFNKDIKVSEN